MQVATSAIADFELSLFDTQPAALCGGRNEFLLSARIDNLVSCFLATEALAQHAAAVDAVGAADERDVSLIALFDHEEAGRPHASPLSTPIRTSHISP